MYVLNFSASKPISVKAVICAMRLGEKAHLSQNCVIGVLCISFIYTLLYFKFILAVQHT